MKIDSSNTAIVDCGKNQATILFNNDISTVNHNELFNAILSLPSGIQVISEQAHLGVPRRGLSKAQPFVDQELLAFYKKCKTSNINLRFFPQGQTPRALMYYRQKHNLSEEDFEKNDYNDPKAILELLQDFPNISLAKPKESFDGDPVREESHDLLKDINAHLNYARSENYSDPNDNCRAWINNNIDLFHSHLSETALNVFGLTDSTFKRGERKGKVNTNNPNFKMTQFYSIIAFLIDYDGKKRVRPSTNNLCGIYYIKKYLLKSTAFHFRGGVARSNLYHHGIKNYVKQSFKAKGFDLPLHNQRGRMNKDQDDFFKILRSQYNQSIIEVLRLTKTLLQDTYKNSESKIQNSEDIIDINPTNQLNFNF